MNDKLTQAISGWADSLVNLVPVLTRSDEMASMKQVRASYTTFQAQQLPPDGVQFAEVNMGGVPATLVQPEAQDSEIVLIYLHGGAYIVGEPAGYRGIGGNYAKLLGARVYIPDTGSRRSTHSQLQSTMACAPTNGCWSKASRQEKSRSRANLQAAPWSSASWSRPSKRAGHYRPRASPFRPGRSRAHRRFHDES